MATLPDIDTTTTGWICYWNAIDQGGVTDIDPSEATGALNNWTSYDNGVEGYRNADSGYNITFRVKEDGWVVGYMDRSNNYGYPVSNRYHGAWDIIDTWSHNGTSDDADVDIMAQHINSIRNQFSNSGNMTWNASDIGVWSPQYDNSTTITILSADTNTLANNGTVTWGYTSSSTLEHASIVGRGENYGNDYARVRNSTTGTYLTADHNGNPWGHANIINDGNWDPGAGNTHDIRLGYYYGYSLYAKATITTVWY